MPFWIPILDGAYEVSELGDVKRVGGGKGAVFGRLLHQYDKDSYKVVSLSVGGLPRRYYVHRLVAVAFIGECPDGCVVNHVDGDRGNCKATNLEYITRQENGRHAVAIGRVPQGEEHGHAKLTNTEVREIRQRYARGETQAALRRQFKLSPSTMHHIVHGVTWKSVV